MLKEEFEAIVQAEVLKYLERLGIKTKLQLVEKLVQATAQSLDMIENDPHIFTRRRCRTCELIGDLINRKFGCYRRSGTKPTATSKS